MLAPLALAAAPAWRAGLLGALGCVMVVVAGLGLLAKEPGFHRWLLGLAYLALLALIAAQDLRTLRAPNRIVYPALGFAVVASLSLGWANAAEALLGGAVALATLLIVALAGRGAMGYGDVKVGALCGIMVGLHGVLPMLMLTFLSGALVALMLLVLRVRRRKDPIAFTPFLAAATAFSLAYYPLYLST